MTLTKFPNGLSSFGVPVMGGIAGIPFTGQYFFVDPANGNDGNQGTEPSRAKATLAAAHALCLAGRNDVVVLIGNGQSSGSARLTETLEWSKDATHLVGVTAPTAVAQRARLATDGTEVASLVEITGDGCAFLNFSVFHGDGTGANTCWTDQGERNYYGNVNLQGMGTQAAADAAASRTLVIGQAGQGVGEHTFERCTFGLDTIERDAANATIELVGGSPRNLFDRCQFVAQCDAGDPVHVLVGALGIDRWALFRDCFLHNFGTAMTVAMDVDASPGGNVVLQRTTSLGATDLAAAGGVFLDGGAPTAASTGLAVAVA